jgi:hypothetical protein
MFRRLFKRNPEKRKAWIISTYAIASGKLKKEPCEVCGTVIKVQAHHDDYLKPLVVRWLCKWHHMEHHRKNNSLIRK